MTAKKIAPYGSWPSPLSARSLATASISFGDIVLDGDSIYWGESRPADDGRSVIVCQDATGKITDITPSGYSVRSRVHEYGGGAYTVNNGCIYFVNDKDQQVYYQDYHQNLAGQVIALTANKNCRYADLHVDKKHQQLICIEENHSEHGKVTNKLVAISLTKKNSIVTLASGHDFFASPTVSPNSKQLAWLTWDHPDMPWDMSQLWCADLSENGNIGEPRLIAGGENESIFQPQWSPAGDLFFVSDKSGWWNIYRYLDGKNICVLSAAAEFGLPQWVFAMSTYGFLDSTTLICCYNKLGIWQLATINYQNGSVAELALPFVAISGIRALQGRAVFIGSTNNRAPELISLAGGLADYSVIKRSSENALSEADVSLPEAITFPTSNNDLAHGFYYAPVNKKYTVDNELPPLLVKSHGGPTAATTAAYNQKIQYWTTRGFAVLDVNYRGSTGFGKEYRQQLDGNWGIADVEDCVNGASYLAKEGKVDSTRMAISGSSAGGYTVLCALTFHDVFRTGASLYGISELEALARDTHKFESHYLDRLIGPYPEDKEKYFKRSPINYTEKLSTPIAFFQGSEDKVVPPLQAELMVDALDKKGLPVVYELFSGEQHGFRKADNIIRAIEGELYFYSKILGFDLPEEISEIRIRNFDD